MRVIYELSVQAFIFFAGFLGLNADECTTKATADYGVVYVCEVTRPPARSRGSR